MDQGLIPRRYAKALYKVACDREVAPRLYDIMRTLSASFASQPALQNVVANPFVNADEKVKLIDTAAAATSDDTTFADFMRLLIQNHRIDMVRDIARAYIDIYRRDRNIYPVEVVTAAPLDPEEEKRMRSFIASHLGSDASMEYTSRVDPDLIGGFLINIDSERLDASVKNQLKQLRLNLLRD